MLRVNVQDGTDGCRRRVRAHPSWKCRCVTPCCPACSAGGHPNAAFIVHPGTRYSCPTCGTRRPT